MKLKHRKYSYLALFLLVFFCNGSSRYFIKKEFPDNLYSSARSGMAIVSASSIRNVSGKKRIVYRQWRFVEASRTHVFIVYEEHYDSRKETPDLTEELKIPIEEDAIKINSYRIRIFELKEDFIAFYLDRER